MTWNSFMLNQISGIFASNLSGKGNTKVIFQVHCVFPDILYTD